MKPVNLSTEASEEFVETVAFYSRIRSVELIQQYPDSGRPMARGFRRVLTNRFPYAVIYVERDTDLFVIAVAHTSRRPGYWKERLADG